MKRMLVIAATLYLTAGVTLFCIIKSTPQDKMRNAEQGSLAGSEPGSQHTAGV